MHDEPLALAPTLPLALNLGLALTLALALTLSVALTLTLTLPLTLKAAGSARPAATMCCAARALTCTALPPRLPSPRVLTSGQTPPRLPLNLPPRLPSPKMVRRWRLVRQCRRSNPNPAPKGGALTLTLPLKAMQQCRR